MVSVFATWVTNLTGFALLLLAYAAALYLLFLAAVFVRCLQKEKVFALTSQLGLLAVAALVYLLTCATWFFGLQ